MALLALLMALPAECVRAEELRPVAAGDVPVLSPEGEEVFSRESPIGPLEYRPGRGLRVGHSGLTIGGFVSSEAEWLEEDNEAKAGIEGVNFLLFYDPVSYLHVFSEVEVDQIVEFDNRSDGAHSNPDFKVERLYADLSASDLLNLRVGKFLTPIGRWNLTHAEPLVWTASEPMLVDGPFDELLTGASLWGALFPRGDSFSYWLYGNFIDPLDPDSDAPPADYSAGARIEYASLDGWALGASYFGSEPDEEEWNHLGGVDALWRPCPRLELTAEALFGEGSQEDGMQWGAYLQSVFELVPAFYLVGRYEHFEPPDDDIRADVLDAGFAWVPVPYLRFKADYRFADHRNDVTEPGLRASLSVLF